MVGFNPHTHAGCDKHLKLIVCTGKSFNPHTHAGCDGNKVRVPLDKGVSIHTPTQGVTHTVTVSVCRYHVSIHTPTQGVTIMITILSTTTVFQSTHPRRVWPWEDIISGEVTLFQSTHPRRVWRRGSFFDQCYMSVSIHTPTQGVTSNPPSLSYCNGCFNPHTHAGCDDNISVLSVLVMFQSTHPRRVWLSWIFHCSSHHVFQSTHPRRVWL